MRPGRGAAALGLDRGDDAVGSIRVGGPADLQVLDGPGAAHLAYRPGMPLTVATWRRGVRTPPPGQPRAGRGRSVTPRRARVHHARHGRDVPSASPITTLPNQATTTPGIGTSRLVHSSTARTPRT